VSRALLEAAAGLDLPEVEDVSEVPGQGLCGTIAGRDVRLGRREWCGVAPIPDPDAPDAPVVPGDTQTGTEIWLAGPGMAPRRFVFADTLRPDAAQAVAALRAQGLRLVLLSGDRRAVVSGVARDLDIDDFEAEVLPDEKVARVRALNDEGHRVLMVGDGLNDAPALAAGFASMSPATAADISKTAADVIFQGEGLSSVPATILTATSADRLVRQNFALAFLYNVVAVPLAAAGLATPLIAAVAMSSSSLIVTLNALRLRLMTWRTG